jgi:hypothetical protein
MDNDFEVSLVYPVKDGFYSGGRTVVKADLSLEDATAYAISYSSSHPEMQCDLWVTRSPQGAGVQFIKSISLHDRDQTRR